MKHIVKVVISCKERDWLEEDINKAIEEQESNLYKLISVSSPCVIDCDKDTVQVVVILTFVQY